jgi:hypothetical protein
MPNYQMRWDDVWQKYLLFATTQDDPHPSRALVALVRQSSLMNDLASLYRPYGTSYYDRIEQFTTVARRAKLSPGDTALQKQLDGLEKELCSKELLRPYRQNATAALKSLKTFAGWVEGRLLGVGVDFKQLNPPSQTEIGLITNLVKEGTSISDELEKDLEAYITKTPATLSALRKDPPFPPAPQPGT